ncbi:KTSC domain-containing protein [Sinorhizobium alkalisoli]|uniref:KTSC domain-containing protein n=1 Tax=Sinorhizobium alkalisoli TaxID=1752398 RepID=A0A1E3VBT7_9HYPH|nr:KTSC domain-containing protein [Sinorhizobium alkalisoli]ODR90897.1 KTSC domain-containing protein [Sinorhizobium alkalisoli]QFI68004.1 hypothetical protein EKH55_3130 [Sinorhizobium alkalisoli]
MPIVKSSAVLDSSAIHDVAYDVRTRTLTIWLLGNRRPYHYLGVPLEVYEELVHAESAGHFFNEHIRHHYKYMH